MRIWTAHTREFHKAVLVPEGFSTGALLFGPFWLAAHRAWIAAGIALAAYLFVWLLFDGTVLPILLGGIAVALGFSGYDLVRAALRFGGYDETQILAAQDETGALARLFAERPEQFEEELREHRGKRRDDDDPEDEEGPVAVEDAFVPEAEYAPVEVDEPEPEPETLEPPPSEADAEPVVAKRGGRNTVAPSTTIRGHFDPNTPPPGSPEPL